MGGRNQKTMNTQIKEMLCETSNQLQELELKLAALLVQYLSLKKDNLNTKSTVNALCRHEKEFNDYLDLIDSIDGRD
jgi:hypothetical protein